MERSHFLLNESYLLKPHVVDYAGIVIMHRETDFQFS